jgi:nucleoside-diphosphate-sugar epimerase
VSLEFERGLIVPTMITNPLILVTGSAGCVGRAVVKEFVARGLNVRCFDRVPTPDMGDQVVGDIVDPAACSRALAGVSTLIHLAATPDDVDDPVKHLFGPNIVGVYHLLEAARQAGVTRMVLTSSAQVVWGQRSTGPFPIDDKAQPSPRYWYAATKMFLEAAGRAFSDKFGISVLAIRLGWCPRPGQEKEFAEFPGAKDIYLSPGDAGRFFACAATAPANIKFGVFYATSKPAGVCPYDMEPARRLLGYEPRDRWDEKGDCAK